MASRPEAILRLRRSGRLLAFGGGYSNLQACEALLVQAATLGISPENIVCTGDTIAYGADAAACLRRLRGASISSIMGNCEESLSQGADDCGCGFAPGSACDALAAFWYAHAAADIDVEDRRYMASLPRRIEIALDGKKLAVLHGNAERINAFVFPTVSNLELERQIALTGADAVLAGHCGIPFTRSTNGGIWHNPGSIGMPANDGTPRGWFSIIEVQAGDIVIEPHALDYDYAAAAAAMRAAALPEGYAAALENGIWPSLDILPAAERCFTGVPVEARQVAEAPPMVALDRLERLWVNTGTLCNLACTGCFMESTPSNDSLAYFRLDDLAAILHHAPAGLTEIGFTGGEPFMNPDMLAMLELCLQAGLQVLVLSNAMRPMQRHSKALARLVAKAPGWLHMRVSLDHYLPARHEALRGKASFIPSLVGLKFLQTAGAGITVASRTPWGETEAMMRAGFARLFAQESIAIDAANPEALILFPEMDTGSPMPAVTQAALLEIPPEKPLMCASSRMVVRRRGEDGISYTPCTLLAGRDMGAALPAANAAVTLDHPYCAQFCVYGGASCAGAPG